MENTEIQIIKQGAEGKISTCYLLNRMVICKTRFKKTYRHPILDKQLTSKRLAQEAKTLVKLYSHINTPALYYVDTIENQIFMEFIPGCSLRDYLISHSNTDDLNLELNDLAVKIATAIGNMHALNIIHGDLTTSNMMLRKDDHSLVMIDFGLSYQSSLIEDKAVDLYVLERAISSTHPSLENWFNDIMAEYSKIQPKTMPRLEMGNSYLIIVY